MEIANGFSELNDPLEQRRALPRPARASATKGDDEAHRMDEDYVRALGHGLPPTGGCGVGIDRLAMILTGLALDPRRDPVPPHASRAGRTGRSEAAERAEVPCLPCPSSCGSRCAT